MSEKLALKFWPLVLIIAFAAFSRFLLLGVHNVSPIAAIALFGGAYFAQRHWAYLIPIAAMWITDIFLNNTVYAQYYDGFVWFGNLWVYAAFLLVVLLGQGLLKKIKPLHVLFAAVGASILFFIVTNFGVWMGTALYPKTWIGLIECYVAAIPFFKNTLVGNILVSSILFGGYELIKYYKPGLITIA